MYPRFVLNGAEYQAHRIYRRIGYRYVSAPLAVIHCQLCGQKNAADTSVSPRRRRFLRILRCSLPSIFLFALIMIPCSGWLFAPRQSIQEMLVGMFAVVAMAVMCGLSAWFNDYYHFNDRTR